MNRASDIALASMRELGGKVPAAGSAEQAHMPAAERLALRRSRLVLAIVFFTLAASAPLFGGDFYVRLAIEACLLGLLALSVDILLGRAGLLSLGQAAYFGWGAYTAALVYLHVSQSLWVVLLCVVAGTTLVSLLVGAVAIRSSGVYFALITFGVGEVFSKAASNTAALGGSDGINGVGQPVLQLFFVGIPLQSHTAFLYVVLALLLGVYLLTQRLLDTPFGAVLEGLRDNPARLPYLGFNPFGYKLAAFVLAANVAALGGMLYPFLRGFVAPVLFGFEFSTRAAVMALVGGLGSLIGPYAGAAAVTFLEDAVGHVTRHHLFAIGALFVLFVLVAPAGLAGWLRARLDRTGAGSGRA